MNKSNDDSLNRYILDGTERCVACGLCLPWCPTYQLEHSEFESPRGRLALLQAIARSELNQMNSTSELLHHCLLCRSCEKHCPSSVPFGHVMDAGRRLALQAIPRAAGLSRKLAEFALRRPEWIRRLGYPASILSNLLPASITIKPATKRRMPSLSYLPSVQAHSAWQAFYPSVNDNRGRVSLFLGCTSRTFDARTIDDTIKLLNLQGFDVHIPPNQACCGALSLHEGRHDVAVKLMRTNLSVFGGEHVDSIIHMATGCGVTMNEYYQHVADDYDFSGKVSEICTFIDQQWLNKTRIHESTKHVMLHSPCSSQKTNSTAHLLSRIPGLKVTELNNEYGCCGAAGTYMLSRPETAAALRSPMLDQILTAKPDAVVTTNPGCALHLSDGLRASGLETVVLHPVSMLVDRLT